MRREVYGEESGVTKRNVIISSFVAVAIAVVAIANMGTARFTVIVLDEQTRRPIEDVDVIGCFANHYLRWENASEEIVHHKHTDRNGRCAFWGKTNCGEAGVRVRRYPGYYDSEILRIPYTNTDCVVRQPIWKPDNVVVTLMLQRVEHPIPLFVTVARLKIDSNKIADNQGTFAYDLMESAWLPPLGNGKHADIEFTCLPRERLPDGNNGFGGTAHRYKNSIQVAFPGQDNGICAMPSTSLTLKVREAPLDGYGSDLKVWKQLSYDLQRDEGLDKDRNFCFRIRTRRNEEGKIIESYYGKIYGDIEVRQKYDGDIPSIVGVKFLYYLNPNSLDRNLEYKTGSNLNPVKPNPADGHFKP